jgi:hypothetical protein
MQESSTHDLYQNIKLAFPKTRYREHAYQPIKIMKIEWTPFLGLKTLFVKGAAINPETHKEYNPIIVFKEVKYHKTRDKIGLVEIATQDEKKYLFEKLSHVNNDILVKCNCMDFEYRFRHYNFVDHSLYGRDRKKYESDGPSANPKELAGVCKHLIRLIQALDDAKIVD